MTVVSTITIQSGLVVGPKGDPGATSFLALDDVPSTFPPGQQFAGFDTRAAMLTFLGATDYTFTNGQVVSAGGLSWVYSLGARKISDMDDWLPFGDVYPDHFASNTTPGTTDMLAALQAANAHTTDVHLLDLEYFTSDTWRITKNETVVRGTGANSKISIDPSTTVPAIIIGKNDPATDGRINGVKLRDFTIAGGSNASRTRHLIEILRGERCSTSGVRLMGGLSGVSIQGGQLNSITNHHQSSGGPAATVAGTSVFQVKEYDLGGGGYEAAFTINISDFFLSGGSNNGTEHIFDITSADGIQVTNGYTGRCGKSPVKLGPTVYSNVAALFFTNVYFDGVDISTGSPNGIYVPSTASAGTITGSFVNCSFGQTTGDILDIDNAKLRFLDFTSCTFSNSGSGGIGSVAGDTSLSKVAFTGCRFANAGKLEASSLQLFSLVNCDFNNISGTNAVELSGTISNLVYDNLTFRNGSGGLSDISTGSSIQPVAHWYETASWTPVVSDAETAGNAAATSSSVGRFTRTGNIVEFSFHIQDIDTTGMTGGNELYIQGLPYTVENSVFSTAGGPSVVSNVSFTTVPVVSPKSNTTTLRMRESVSGGAVNIVKVSQLTSGTATIWGHGSYRVA